MTEGPEGWEELRKVSVWQTTAALQQEMEAKMIKVRCCLGQNTNTVLLVAGQYATYGIHLSRSDWFQGHFHRFLSA